MGKQLSVIESSQIEWVPVDSLQKIFMKKEPLSCPRAYELSGMEGETVSFQMAYRYRKPYYSSQMMVQATKNPSVRVRVQAPEGIRVKIRKVGYVPSAYPAYGEYDSDYLTTEPGLYPDPLEAMGETIQLIPFYWRSLWIDLEIPKGSAVKNGTVVLQLETLQGEIVKGAAVEIHVVPCELPALDLIHTEWFYSDCLADYYKVPVFSEDYWKIVGNFMRAATKRGVNMILTPLFTLPLDTLIGNERTTVQLVDVWKHGESFNFGFEKLERWIALAKESGFTWLEMGHLFSQWGAKYAPKVVAVGNEKETRLFGWETKADSAEYRTFLNAFLPELTKELERLGIEKQTYFHISDEPNAGNIETYKIAREMVREELKDYPILDALSTLPFYKKGIVSYPVPTNEHIHEFLDAGFEHPWVYYCSGEYLEVSNRFFAQPSYRNRILGVQMYLYEIEGFLHWGYNYYNSQYSIRHIDPYRVTDADDAFPSGDSFLVYPGEDGDAVESLRFLVLEEGLNDYRALKQLETYKGKEYVHTLIEKMAGMKITFSDYPRNAAFLLELRERVNKEIEECL